MMSHSVSNIARMGLVCLFFSNSNLLISLIPPPPPRAGSNFRHLLSCGTIDRIAQNPLLEESISSNRLNPAWDRFPTPLSVVRPVRVQFNAIYWGDLPNACHCLKQVVRPIRGHDWYSSDLELLANTDCPGRLISEMPQASPSDMAAGSPTSPT